MDKRFRIPRIWSNEELRKFSHLYTGEVINVSAWKDLDKEGKRYKDYFVNASEYFISNHPSFQKGYQQAADEILLDLEDQLSDELRGKFSVVLNHTVLEHIFDFRKAVENFCAMSNDTIITVVPFMQQMHGYYDEGGYGDYWRFTPLSLTKMFEQHGFFCVYQCYNDHENASVYVIHVCSKYPEKWKGKMPNSRPHKDSTKNIGGYPAFIGSNMIS